MKIDNSIKTVAGVSISDGQKRADKNIGVNPNPARPANTASAERSAAGGGAKARSPQAAGFTGNESARPVDNVHLSPLSSQLQAIDRNLANSGVVDTARVEEIKQAISEGRFKVNPEAVADRLLETVRELIQSQKGKT